MAPVALCLLATIVDKKHAHRNGENILRKLEVNYFTFCNYTYFMHVTYRMGPKSVMNACPRHPILDALEKIL